MSEDKKIKNEGETDSSAPQTSDDTPSQQHAENAEQDKTDKDNASQEKTGDKSEGKTQDEIEKKPEGKTQDKTEKKPEGKTQDKTEKKPEDAENSDTSSKTESGERVIGPETSKDKASSDDKNSRPRGSRDRYDKGIEKYWLPKTKLGIMVRDGSITTIEQVLDSGFILREPEIVDILLGEMQDEVIDVNMVQRMTDSGRRVRFAVTVAVGNENGYLGVGRAHGKEVGPTIRKAIDNAKTNIISLKRGCGSWECGCGTPHSIPFKTHGKSGSVVVTFLPAPKGVGLAVGDVAKKILTLGGVKDLWATTRGQTQTTWNYASAVYKALMNLSRMRINQRQQEKFKILSGGIEE